MSVAEITSPAGGRRRQINRRQARSVGIADPIFAAIEEHWRAYVAANQSGISDATRDALVDVEGEAFEALGQIEPTTGAGLLALVFYLNRHIQQSDLRTFIVSDTPIVGVLANVERVLASNGGAVLPPGVAVWPEKKRRAA